MLKKDFYYELPPELIATYPTENRTDSRLMVVHQHSDTPSHTQFSSILSYLKAGDLMVFNNTRVIPARLFGQKVTGGKLEVLVERVLNSSDVLAHVRSSKSPKEGALITFDGGAEAEVLGRKDALFHLRFLGDEDVLAILERIGHMPLPPYIERGDEDFDKERYQTVYGEKSGAVAAPTAGLHFDESLLESIRAMGVDIAFVTLHVGAGTFQPVRAEKIEDHVMHSEVMVVDDAVCEKVRAAKAGGGRVIAVGTTSVRCLESASQAVGEIAPFAGETDIFIYPGYTFKTVDMLVTNFHLPESTLLMLVSAFSGYEKMMQAYKTAVEEKYRFFSYGDSMLLFNQNTKV